MALGDLYSVRVRGWRGTAEWNVVQHYITLLSVGTKTAEMAGLAQAVGEHWTGSVLFNDARDFLTTNAGVSKFEIRDVINNTLGADLQLDYLDGIGTFIGDPLSKQLCVLGQKQTALIGASYSGRSFLPFGSELVVSGNEVDSVFVDDVLTWYADLMAIVSSPPLFGFAQVVYSPTLGTSEVVTGVSVVNQTKTQRRRTA